MNNKRLENKPLREGSFVVIYLFSCGSMIITDKINLV